MSSLLHHPDRNVCRDKCPSAAKPCTSKQNHRITALHHVPSFVAQSPPGWDPFEPPIYMHYMQQVGSALQWWSGLHPKSVCVFLQWVKGQQQQQEEMNFTVFSHIYEVYWKHTSLYLLHQLFISHLCSDKYTREEHLTLAFTGKSNPSWCWGCSPEQVSTSRASGDSACPAGLLGRSHPALQKLVFPQ